ncbi:MAG: hypothetical protein EOP47_29660 [Sphingobacteriaceae bacterium]|nr:MAG: hypothetical protein EOP47_29660 [Sphingobacteriaceae bacterium]
MSMALFIRNINPDCDPNAKLIVVTLDDSNPRIPEMALKPLDATSFNNADDKLYWFPRTTPTRENILLINDIDNSVDHCDMQDSAEDDYLWFCELDHAV